jgi:hypothetical protein
MPIILPGASIAPWSDLVSNVLPHTPECPLFEIEDRLRQAAREFCRISCAWRSPNVALLTTVADQVLYTYSTPAQAELNRVHTAFNGDDEIDVALPGEEDDVDPTSSGEDWKITVDSETQLRLTQPPATAGIELTGTLSYVPTNTATGIPTLIARRWQLQIAAGAAALLVVQARKPWSNPAAAAMLSGMFQEGIRSASNDSGPVRRRPIRVIPA